MKIDKQLLLRTLLVTLVLVSLYNYFLYNEVKKSVGTPVYSEFLKNVKENKVQEVLITQMPDGTQDLSVTEGNKKYHLSTNEKDINSILVNNNVKVKWTSYEGDGVLAKILWNFGPILLMLGVYVWFMKKQTMGGKGGGGLFSMSKSKAELIDPDNINVSFSDVVGCDEAKLEAKEFVDFLKNPEKFTKLGGRTPRGLLLTGPAGTGKTLLAKAIAKESGVPFFSTSGSDFIEMLVGLGAARVRDMFETAKKSAPCVIFIDEIDAIGGKRSASSMSGGQDEREQTLMQLLVELDGMSTNKGIILIAATNRPEVLDPALLRPGRIDRQIIVHLPDVHGREEILRLHSKKVPLFRDVDFAKIARGTAGFSGAELANVINEASILAGRKSKQFVDMEDLQDAVDKIMMGAERPGLAMTQEDLRDTAYHEAGHAIVAKLLPNADPVHKVSIVPRGKALGVTVQVSEKDRWSYKKEFLTEKIAILMGGRAAEELFLNTQTNGASNDIMVATNIARSMVAEWGMSSLGPIAYGQRGQSYLGGNQINMSGISPEILKQVDDKIIELINEQFNAAISLLKQNSDKVEAMVEALMEEETIDDWQVDNIMEGRHYKDNIGLLEHNAKQAKLAEDAIKLKESKKNAFESKQKKQIDSDVRIA